MKTKDDNNIKEEIGHYSKYPLKTINKDIKPPLLPKKKKEKKKK